MPKKKSIKKASVRPQNLNTRLFIVGTLIGVLLVFILLLRTHPSYAPSLTMQTEPSRLFDFGAQSYTLNDQNLTFIHGNYSYSDPISGHHTAAIANRSTSPAGTRAAAIIVDNPGGSGTFYYVVGAMSIHGKETYSFPIVLGDRIKIVSLTISDPQAHDNGQITITYLTHKANDPMSAEPTVNKTRKFSFEENGNLIEVLH